MNFIAYTSFYCFIGLISAFSMILATPIKQMQQQEQRQSLHHRTVRDLFVTTGWGGAGLPHSTFYITGKQLKEINESNGDNKKRNVDQNPEIISLVECLECNGKVIETDEKKKTERRTVPQLFSSSGWGPLGRRRR